ncbi:kinase-like domain-containing protein [Rhizophagus clarus]|uniref:Kinase-like domain-containing protein n=1 Tax=Rhizophagus clarus TaxID=94130 RepID=A0A8H3QTM1_9GLOM|nr:kinase-like domain-containing protein [Rhizophagus clarus]
MENVIKEKGQVINKLYLSNLNDESNDSDNLRKIIEKFLHENQHFGICPGCNRPNTFRNWCKECYSKKFQQNFGNWTSGNEQIDKFIKESQLNARNWSELLEWIPYNRLRNIKYLAQGGFSTVYKAIWLDGKVRHWDYEKQGWNRSAYKIDEQYYEDASNSQIKNPLKIDEKYGYPIVLKSLNDSSNLNEDFLNEWKLHLQCHYEAFLNGTLLIPIIGITQDPDTLNYMIVLQFADGSLRNNLLIKKYNPNDKFENLDGISSQLQAIHKLNLVYGDLHNGNILHIAYYLYVSDLGLCRPDNQPNIKNEIYGVIPYIAPEVLRGKPYTKASDIYSFGIIMWEMTSGVPAFHNIPHDINLCLNICRGDRPEIIEGTMPEYVELMKRCWDNDPEKRPTANELRVIFTEWKEKYPIEEDEEKRIPIPENEQEIIYHPKSCYTSRKFDYSARLNEILLRDELSDKIVITDNKNDNNVAISKNLDELDDCIIKSIKRDLDELDELDDCTIKRIKRD